jgi:hypothetical protein
MLNGRTIGVAKFDCCTTMFGRICVILVVVVRIGLFKDVVVVVSNLG